MSGIKSSSQSSFTLRQPFTSTPESKSSAPSSVSSSDAPPVLFIIQQDAMQRAAPVLLTDQVAESKTKPSCDLLIDVIKQVMTSANKQAEIPAWIDDPLSELNRLFNPEHTVKNSDDVCQLMTEFSLFKPDKVPSHFIATLNRIKHAERNTILLFLLAGKSMDHLDKIRNDKDNTPLMQALQNIRTDPCLVQILLTEGIILNPKSFLIFNKASENALTLILKFSASNPIILTQKLIEKRLVFITGTEIHKGTLKHVSYLTPEIERLTTTHFKKLEEEEERLAKQKDCKSNLDSTVSQTNTTNSAKLKDLPNYSQMAEILEGIEKYAIEQGYPQCTIEQAKEYREWMNDFLPYLNSLLKKDPDHQIKPDEIKKARQILQNFDINKEFFDTPELIINAVKNQDQRVIQLFMLAGMPLQKINELFTDEEDNSPFMKALMLGNYVLAIMLPTLYDEDEYLFTVNKDKHNALTLILSRYQLEGPDKVPARMIVKLINLIPDFTTFTITKSVIEHLFKNGKLHPDFEQAFIKRGQILAKYDQPQLTTPSPQPRHTTVQKGNLIMTEGDFLATLNGLLKNKVTSTAQAHKLISTLDIETQAEYVFVNFESVRESMLRGNRKIVVAFILAGATKPFMEHLAFIDFDNGGSTPLSRAMDKQDDDLTNALLDLPESPTTTAAAVSDSKQTAFDEGSLQTMTLDNANMLNFAALVDVRKLVIKNRTGLTDTKLLTIGMLPLLQVLELENCQDITDKGINNLKNLGNLRKLVINHCPGLTDNGLKIIKVFRQLESLDLYNCPSLTSTGLRELANLPLGYLNLRECKAMLSTKQIFEFTTVNPNFKYEFTDPLEN